VLATPALAEDGVIEINHARALAGGVTPLDAPGYPVSLSSNGSYRLTSNLTQPDVNTNVIEVNAAGVTIDLGGFMILGPVGCSPVPVVCTPAGGSGRAVLSLSFGQTTVRNGTIFGTAQGLLLGESCRVEGVKLTHVSASPLSCSGGDATVRGVSVTRSGGSAIVVAGGLVENSTARANGATGIQLNGSGTIRGCLAEGNGGSGIGMTGSSGTAAVVADSTASGNGIDGIAVLGGSTVTGSVAIANAQDGIQTGPGSTVTGSNARGNGQHGFVLGRASTLTGSTARANVVYGLFIEAASGFGGNVFEANNGGQEAQVFFVLGASSFQLGTNVCQGDTTCP